MRKGKVEREREAKKERTAAWKVVCLSFGYFFARFPLSYATRDENGPGNILTISLKCYAAVEKRLCGQAYKEMPFFGRGRERWVLQFNLEKYIGIHKPL